MAFSTFLESKIGVLKLLIAELHKNFKYVSILGTDVKSVAYNVNLKGQSINDSLSKEKGFVCKMTNGGAFYEYSFDQIEGSVQEFAQKIIKSLELNEELLEKQITSVIPADEELWKFFERKNDFNEVSEEELIKYMEQNVKELKEASPNVLNALCIFQKIETSKVFLSTNRFLKQNYGWIIGYMVAVYANNGKVVEAREAVDGPLLKVVMKILSPLKDKLIHKAEKLTLATQIEPGVYDVITDPSITGLIAHEAFGHGVEMDQFVKHRALATEYVGKYVASPITNMKDGAASTRSVASYFFDDDGILAGDTQIIKDGILLTGISDLVSASVLNTSPTGNGRRESFKNKVYTRMTNTFFEKGTDKLEDMIASIKHGYMLFDTNNGMEDPKNWAIQCTAEYGIEIVDGKLTDNYVSPVVISGYVPDLLKSISMISDGFDVSGAGACGKGHKEWVRVSDGGPALKVRAKLS